MQNDLPLKKSVIQYIKESKIYLSWRKIRVGLKNIKWREKRVSFGKMNADKTFYVIRNKPENGGFFFYFTYNLCRLMIAQKRKLVPVIDMENYTTYYSEKDPINHSRNAWEYFFEQPTGFSLEEVYQSKNVVLSSQLVPSNDFLPNFDKNFYLEDADGRLKECCEIVKHQMKFNETTKYYLQNAWDQIKKDQPILAVMSRGTDYKKLKPQGHPIQPGPELLIEKTKQIMEEHDIKYCFLKTEERQVLELFQKEFGNGLLFCDATYYDDFNQGIQQNKIFEKGLKYYKNRDLFITGYIKSNNTKAKYLQTLEYLRDVFIASKCDYLLSGDNGGSRGAILLNDCQYKNIYLIDIGRYAKKTEHAPLSIHRKRP